MPTTENIEIKIQEATRDVVTVPGFDPDTSGIWGKYQATTNKVSRATCNIGTLISLFIPLAMIVMDAVYINSCPAEHYIPLYLVVSGAFLTGYALLNIATSFCMDENGVRPRPAVTILGLMSLFNLAWFIAGNVWIYGLKDAYSTNLTDPNYCNNTLYLFAFWITTATYILTAVILTLFCCVACCMGCIGCCVSCMDDD